ncbi:branched-chain amino acid transport system ATP-binding protein [Stella humosa]|uniref:Branched-chain amino acid transport system ATP-binding protein n=1 Tax=Stella humosa TaxID=94 RepID=A0A3N1MC68_9PROT|nr:ABC transporter ATP-binding protein [Stella humosa]ROQ00307.1 branched-chain amino acid transport system ATP-binding protein [Stella humosa]BBK30455.1 ABC transporter ATP-binding protein [Stella humosa]
MLQIADLAVAYGPIQVLNGVSMSVAEGEIVALIGANGAGKTTILNTVSGLLRPARGEIRFAGQRIDGQPPERIVAAGLAQVPEGRKVFRNLTVHECLRMGGLVRRDKAGVAADIERMYGLFPRLRERHRQLAGTLSGGEQQMLAFGRALVARPKVLLLDEPSMGLAPRIVAEIARLILDIRREGMTVLLVEQNAAMALGLADRGYVLEAGRILLEADARSLLADERVRRSYLGL